MADVMRVPGVFEQIRLVAGVRWLILKNSLRRKQNRWDLIGMIWVGFFSAALTAGMAVAFYVGGYAFVSKNRAEWLGLLYWGIFLWWQVLPVFAAGFGTNFEFASLLRFPLNLRAFYLLGLGYGLTDFGGLAAICWIVAMIVGAGSAELSIVPAMLLVSVLFIVLNVTLERLIGSWVEKILAKRRMRELFIGGFILAMVSLNFLNPAIQRWGTGGRARITQSIPYLAWSPGSLAGHATAAAAVANSREFVTRATGLFAWVVLMSMLLWRRFAAQFAGEEISDSPGPMLRKARERKRVVAEEGLVFLPASVAGMIAKEFRYLTRNGFAFVGLVIPPAMVLFFTMQFGPGSMLKEHSVKPGLFFPGITAYLILILMSPAYNSFAYEGKGIQTYFMSPVPFRDVILGKNLFVVVMIVLELILCLALLTMRVGWPGTPLFVSTLMAGALGVTGQLTIANWSSLSFPKKMELGKMKGQRNSGVAVWTAFGVQIVLGGICGLVLFLGQWTGNPWLPTIAFALLTAAAGAGYVASLRAVDRLAESKKELLIETLCR
jgi:ABC-2 type transport system permease protein